MKIYENEFPSCSVPGSLIADTGQLNWNLLLTVTQHGDKGWNRTYLPIDINPSIIHPAHERLYHTTGIYAPYSLRTAWRVLLRPTRIRLVKELWDGAYDFWSLSKKTKECLTIWRCRNKDSTFFSVILRPLVLIRPGFVHASSCTADRRLSNWANRADKLQNGQVLFFLKW